MITGTLSRYFGMRFLTSVIGSFIGVVALAAMIDYVELMRRGADWPNATALVARQDFHVPRPAAYRTHHAVLGAGRRDVVLLDAFAPARTRRRARGRHFGLAIRGAGDDRGASCSARSPPPSITPFPHRCTSAQSVSKPKCWARTSVGAAGEHQRILGAPEKRRRRGHHQCQVEPRARRAARRRHHLHFRRRRPFPAADRGQKRHAGTWLLAARRRAHLRKRQAARRRGHLSARHQSHARAGARELCHAGNGAVLATAHLHRDGGSRRPRRRRLSAAISAAAGASVPARRHGLARGLR